MQKSYQTLLMSLCLYLTPLSAVEVIIENSEDTPAAILQELKAIGQSAGELSMTLSSKNRNVQTQVEIMLDYYILCSKGRMANQRQRCGINLARQVYHSDCHGGFEAFNANKSRAENIAAMSQALSESLIALGDQRTCMNHVVIPGVNTRYVAVDIKPSSISNHKFFYQAVTNNPKVKRFYYPPIKGVEPSAITESAFHLEFERQ
jgi:hypothetical protein